MKFLKFVLGLMLLKFVKIVKSEIDIMNKCPDFYSDRNFDMEKVLGNWFTLELVHHYIGKRSFLQPDVCIIVNVNFEKHEKHRLLPNKSIEIVVLNQNKTSIERKYTTQELKYLLKVNGTKQGLWSHDDDRNVQVIMVEGNFTVFTLCEKAQLISFILSREGNLNATEEKQMAHEFLERRGLRVESSTALCAGSFNQNFDLALLILVIIIMQLTI